MGQLNFYPGPAALYPLIPEWFKEGVEEGIIHANHRSSIVESIIQENKELLIEVLNLPKEYTVCYVSSATECWQVSAQNLVSKHSTHLFNGAFGEKWFTYHQALFEEVNHHSSRNKQALALSFDQNNSCEQYISKIPTNTDFISICQNETSNGTAVNNAIIEKISTSFPKALIGVDATSSLGGIDLPIKSADIIFASVQKCLGLPAGSALMFLSPKAIEKATQVGHYSSFNSIDKLVKNALKNQTSHTPNISNIYLLNRVLKHINNKWKNITYLDQQLQERGRKLYEFFHKETSLTPYIENQDVRSKTVIVLKEEQYSIEYFLKQALAQNILLGKGYGIDKQTTFRIANFPAIEDKSFEILKRFFKSI